MWRDEGRRVRATALAAGFTFACVAASALAPPAAAQSGPGDAHRFKQVELIDRNGFERPIPAVRVLIPADWQAQGGVVWNPQASCAADATRVEWAAGDPRGTGAVEIIPSATWQMSNLPAQYQGVGGCPNAAITNVRQFLETLVQMRRPGAVVLDYRDRPDLAAEFGIDSRPQSMPGSEQRMWAEAGEILIGYRYQSQNVREMIGAGVIFSHIRMAGAMPGEIMEFMNGTALPAFAMRAPDGALDFRLYEAIRTSIKVDPEWQARMNKHNNVIANINAKGAAERSRITSQASSEISDIIHEGWKSRQASMDRGQERWSRAMREQDLYHDPARGEQVELPSHYGHAWRLQDGSYLMTDNPLFDPYVDMGLNATRLGRQE